MSKNSRKNLEFALYEYTNSTNIGDEIQSIAARRFLPRVDYYINRDEAGSWTPPQVLDVSTRIRLIANAWYMSKPFLWPINNPNIDPLFISVHIESEIPKVKEVFSSPKSISYLKKHQPIGCRDTSTEVFLQSLGVETYFSGCLTLTLQKDPLIKKESFILLAGVSDVIYEKTKQQTNRTVIRIESHSEAEDSFMDAEKYLYLYQAAHCVLTSRLHAVLPCLALETPVLFLSDGAMTANKSRFEGLQELSHNLQEHEYISRPSRYNVNKPPKNPSKYKELRTNLIEKCYEFTGYNDNKTFARKINFKTFNLKDCLDLILYNQDYLWGQLVQKKNTQIANLQNEKNNLQEGLVVDNKSHKQVVAKLRSYTRRNFFHK